jgi:ElaB/YqjD/DUF883 family membrane-anchored ribosome-binding protein
VHYQQADSDQEERIMQQSTLGSNVTGSASNVSEKAHAGIDKLTQSAHHAVDRVATAATTAAERVQNVGDTKYGHMAQEWKEQGCAYVRAHPMTAVGIAVAAGYLLSRLTHFR